MTSRPVTTPLVSVVVPYFNAERFLAEAIESVRAQTYSAWELLLADDGGVDASVEIARGYASRDPDRVVCLSHPDRANHGAAAARNLAIRNARGSYIALLDADDVWLPTKLEEQVALLEAHPDVGMVYGNSLYWYGWTGQPADRARDRVAALGYATDTVVPPPSLLARCLRRTAAVPCPCSVVLRREVVERVGAFEESFTGPNASAEDLAFFAKVMLVERVLVANRVWDRYRRHPDSVYERAKAEGIAVPARIHYMEWLRDFLLRREIRDRELWQALETALESERRPPPVGMLARLRESLGRFGSRSDSSRARSRDR